MHEMAIAMEIVDIVKGSIPQDLPDAQVRRINLEVGRLSAIVPDSLRFCFDLIVKGTSLEGAELIIQQRPVVARCRNCQTQWTVTEPVFLCEACGNGSLDMLSGRELDIISIEIEDEDRPCGC